MRRLVTAGALVGALTLVAASAPRGEVIDCAASTFPDCIRVCPEGDVDLPVTLVGTSGNPIAGAVVRLIVSAMCTYTGTDGVLPCPGAAYPVVTGVTDASGRVDFSLPWSGCCSGSGAVSMEVDPGAVVCVSYDSIGSVDSHYPLDGVVGLADFVVFQMAFLSTDTCHDYYGCDDFVALADFVVFQTHFLHACP